MGGVVCDGHKKVLSQIFRTGLVNIPVKYINKVIPAAEAKSPHMSIHSSGVHVWEIYWHNTLHTIGTVTKYTVFSITSSVNCHLSWVFPLFRLTWT